MHASSETIGSLLRPTVSILAALLISGCQSGEKPPPSPVSENYKQARPCPVTLACRNITGGKPPLRWYTTELEIRNNHDRPIWFVFSYWIDDPPSIVDGKIARPGNNQHILEGAGYDAAKIGGVGRMVIVTDVGHFRAIHLPAGGTLRIEPFLVESWKPIDAVDVWEIPDLIVNGATPVEKWLPYDTMSRSGTVIATKQRTADWDNLGWDPNISGHRKDLRKEKISFIAGNVLAHWRVPLTGLDLRLNQNPWK